MVGRSRPRIRPTGLDARPAGTRRRDGEAVHGVTRPDGGPARGVALRNGGPAHGAFANTTHTCPSANATGRPSAAVNSVPSSAFARFQFTS